MALTKKQLLELAQQVRFETNSGQNTAERVGRILVEIIEALGNGEGSDKDAILEYIKGLNIVFKNDLDELLEKKLDYAVFKSAFIPVNSKLEELEWKNAYSSNDFFAIKTTKGFYSDSFISCLEINPDNNGSSGGSGGTGGTSTLAGLEDVSLSSLNDGDSLVYDATLKKWVNKKVDYGIKSVTWNDIQDKPSWIGAQKPSYAFSELTSHPTTLAGYGITDALTPTQANATYVKKTGDTMTGDLTVNAWLYANHIQATSGILKVGSETSQGSLLYDYGGANYLRMTNTSGYLCIIANGLTNSLQNATMVVNSGSVFPGKSQSRTLGTDGNRWETVYSNKADVAKSVTIGKAVISWDEDNECLKVNKGLYSESFLSCLGVNNDAGTGGGGGGLNKSELQSYLDENGYVTSSTLSRYMLTSTANATFVTSLGVNGNSLTWIRNGVTNSITVPYATNADTLDNIHASGFMRTFGQDNETALSEMLTGGSYRLGHDNVGIPVEDTAKYANMLVVRGGTNDTLAQLYFPYNVNRAWMRTGSPTSIGSRAWREFAFTDSNVASADKLNITEPFTAWGQTYFQNGVPKSISGNMSDVGSITASGTINTSAANGFRLSYSSDSNLYGTILRNADNCFYILATAKDNHTGTFSSLRPFTIYNETGNVSLGSRALYINHGGIVEAQNGIKIGDITITYDRVNSGLKVEGGGLYTETYLSCLGVNGNAGAGSGGETLTFVTDGTGNAVTSVTKSGTTVTAYKGATFLRQSDLSDINVSSATRLQTSGVYTAWGQSFFREGVPISISGAMSNVGTVTPGANLTYNNGTSANAWLNVYTEYLRSNTTLYLDTGDSGHSILFRLGGTEHMRLSQPDGYLGIHTSNPSYPLDVNGDSSIRGDLYVWGLGTFDNGVDCLGIDVDTYIHPYTDNSAHIGTSTKRFASYYGVNAYLSGNFGVGTDSPSYKVDVSGMMRSTGLIVNGASTTQGITPSMANTYNLGSFNVRWANVYSEIADFNEIKIGPVTIKYDKDNLGLQISGGGLYTDSYLSCMGVNANAGTGSGGETLTFVTDGTGNAVTSVTKNGTTVTAYKGATFLTTNSNAASASKLLVTHTLWGQDFNGTQSVSGDLSNVGAIFRTLDSATNIDKYGNIQFKQGSDPWRIYGYMGSILFTVEPSNGYVGIGTGSSPTARLHVVGETLLVGDSELSGKLYVSGTSYFENGIEVEGFLSVDAGILPWEDIECNIGTSSKRFKKIWCYDASFGGKVGIGTTSSPSYELDVSGTMRSTALIVTGGSTVRDMTPSAGNTYNLGTSNVRWSTIYGVSGNFSSTVSQNTSDIRLKTDITKASCLSKLQSLGNVVNYRYTQKAIESRGWLDSETVHTGLIYQQAMQAGIPDFTGLDEQGYGYVNFLSSDFQATLLGAVQELSIIQNRERSETESLRLRVQTLEKENRDLKERIELLEATMN